ncbi:hypothetical protein B4086_5471 [Bacillus cereus]|nr:hypothetical protein B4086_5471 [Bacillus cereus]
MVFRSLYRKENENRRLWLGLHPLATPRYLAFDLTSFLVYLHVYCHDQNRNYFSDFSYYSPVLGNYSEHSPRLSFLDTPLLFLLSLLYLLPVEQLPPALTRGLSIYTLFLFSYTASLHLFSQLLLRSSFQNSITVLTFNPPAFVNRSS